MSRNIGPQRPGVLNGLLRDAREGLGVSQREVSRRRGRAAKSQSDLESASTMRWSTAEQIAEALGGHLVVAFVDDATGERIELASTAAISTDPKRGEQQ